MQKNSETHRHLGSSLFQLHYIISAIVYSCKEVLFRLNFLIDS